MRLAARRSDRSKATAPFVWSLIGQVHPTEGHSGEQSQNNRAAQRPAQNYEKRDKCFYIPNTPTADLALQTSDFLLSYNLMKDP